MIGEPYYHGITKGLVVAFGRMFSDVKIIRQNGSTIEQVVAVPISYAPKEKWLARLEGDPSLNNTVQVSLPRLSFEINSFSYDSSRSLSKMNKVMSDNVGAMSRKLVHTPAPYNIGISLYAISKTIEDGFAIMEQILPLFRPDYTLAIKPLSGMLDLVQDVPIVLDGITMDDEYEGDFEERRLITYTFNFTAKIGYYGRISNGVLVNNTKINIADNDTHTTMTQMNSSQTSPDAPISTDKKFFEDLIK